MKSCSVLTRAKSLSLRLTTVALLISVLNSHTSAAVVVLPDVTVTSLGHSHFYDMFMGGATLDGVAIPSGIGSYTTTSFTGQVLNGDTISQQILAPSGQQFVIDRNPTFDYQGLGFNIYWFAGGDAASIFAGPTVTFQNATGTAPTPNYGYGTVGNAGNFIKYEYQADITGDFSFTGITVAFPVLNSPPAGSRTFNIGSNSSPSFYVYGGSELDVDATLMSLQPLGAVPEPTTVVVWGLSLVALAVGGKHLRKLAA